jgi:hypothetical protein
MIISSHYYVLHGSVVKWFDIIMIISSHYYVLHGSVVKWYDIM